MDETPRPSEDRNATKRSHGTEQSREANARAEADAQTEEQMEDQTALTLGDIGSLED